MIFFIPILTSLASGAIGTATAIVTSTTGLAVLGGTVATYGATKIFHNGEVEAARKEGYSYGLRQGNIETAKKFEEQFKKSLEKSDANKIATWALGIYVADLDGIASQELDVIYKKLGDPNSNLVEPALRDMYIAIYNKRPKFAEIKIKYLDVVAPEFLAELNEYVNQIIESDQVLSETEKDFLQYEWYPYLIGRGIKAKAESDSNHQYESGVNEMGKQREAVSKEEDEEFKKLLEETNNGDAVAMFNLGKVFEEGRLGRRKNLYAARNWYKKASDKGFVPAQYKVEDLSRKIMEEIKKEERIQQFKQDQDEAEKLYNEGWRYEHGNDVPKDIEYAKELYRKAALKGNQMAKSRLNFLTQIS